MWEIVGLVFFAGRNGLVPPPTRILSHMFDDGFTFYWHNARDTLFEASVGWLWGNVLAIGLALSFVVVADLRAPAHAPRRRGVLPADHRGRPDPLAEVPRAGAEHHPRRAAGVLHDAHRHPRRAARGRSDDARPDPRVRRRCGAQAARRFASGPRCRACSPRSGSRRRPRSSARSSATTSGPSAGSASRWSRRRPRSRSRATWGLSLVAAALAGAAYGITALVGRLLTPWAPRGMDS